MPGSLRVLSRTYWEATNGSPPWAHTRLGTDPEGLIEVLNGHP